jgi:hypothetical protein
MSVCWRLAIYKQGRNYRGGVSPPPPIFRNGTLVGQKLRKGRAKPGTKLKGGVGGCDTPPKLDWQGKSSGLAGQWKILNFRYCSKNKGYMHVLTGIFPKKIFDL